jgi:hypothetical protein
MLISPVGLMVSWLAGELVSWFAGFSVPSFASLPAYLLTEY